MAEEKADGSADSEQTAEESKAKQKTKEKFSFSKGIPLYLGLLLLVLGLISGVTVGKLVLACPKLDSNASACPNINAPKPILQTMIVYDGNCDFCSKEISFLNVIEANDINNASKLIDAYSEEGKALVKKLQFNFLPALVIDEKSLKDSMQIKTTVGPSIKLKELLDDVLNDMVKRIVVLKKEGYYIMPNMPEFDNKSSTTSFIETPEPCKLDANKARLDEFADYLCPYCASAVETVDALQVKFASGLEYNFRNFVVHEEALKIANAAECARGQDGFDKFMRCAYSKKFTDNKDTTDSNILKECAVAAEVSDMNKFEQCMKGMEALDVVDIETGSDNLAARAYMLSGTPSFVVDCRYVMGIPQVEDAICKLHPDLNCSSA